MKEQRGLAGMMAKDMMLFQKETKDREEKAASCACAYRSERGEPHVRGSSWECGGWMMLEREKKRRMMMMMMIPCCLSVCLWDVMLVLMCTLMGKMDFKYITRGINTSSTPATTQVRNKAPKGFKKGTVTANDVIQDTTG